MLLGTSANNDHNPGTEPLIILLILQQRYAEAYELLLNQPQNQTATLYNIALCLHWNDNYQEALTRLESIQPIQHVNSGKPVNTNIGYKEIRSKQNQTDDYLQGINEVYLKSFPALVQDAIIRLKTDCWLQLGNYAKVIAVATPIAHKGYKNITDALQIANTANDKRI